MKKVLFVVTIISILALCISFTACKTEPATPEYVVGAVNSVDVPAAVEEVYSALVNSCTTQGATEGIYVSFGGYKKTVDSVLAINDKPILYDFALKAYIDNDNLANDTKSTMSFTVKQENGASKFSMYFAGGTLYIDYPPVFSKVAISGLELANIVNTLNQSNIHDGKVHTVSQLIPVLGKYIFKSCEKTVLAKCDDETCNCKNHFEYIFTIDFSKFYSALETVMTSAKLGISADMVLDALCLTKSDLNALASLKTTVTVDAYNSKGGANNYYYLKSFKYDQTEATVTDTLSFSFKKATEFTSVDAQDYKVTLADNLSSYRPFNFMNYDLSGRFTLSTSSVNALNTMFNQPITTELTKNTFTCDYTFKSNYTNDKLTFDLVLGNLFGKEKNLCLYYDGDSLYANLSDYFGKADTNLGMFKFSKQYVQDTLKSMSISKDKAAATTDNKIYLIASVLAGLTHSSEQTVIDIEPTAFNVITNLLGVDFVFDYAQAQLNLNTESSLFKSANLKLIGDSVCVEIFASSPKIGYEVLVEKPSWVDNCTDWQSMNRVTPVVKGTISTNINNATNTMLVQSLIESMTGAEVKLQGSISKFVYESNYSTSGKLQIAKLSFLDSSDVFVCALYYYADKNSARSDELYVILPEQDGITPVQALKLQDSSRYVKFLGTINGNALVVDEQATVVLSNNDSSFTLAANRDGVANVLSFIHGIFKDTYLTQLPIDFATSSISLTVGEQTLLKTTFGLNKHIDLSIDSIVLDTYSLALKTQELNGHKGKTVSIFDGNDMAEYVTVEMYGSEQKAITVDTKSFGGWQYENIPSLGSGVEGINEVNAYVNLFGQKVIEVVTVNCLNADEYEVKVDMDYAKYIDNEKNEFNFDKYVSDVNPVQIIESKFNTIDLTIGNKHINKQVEWKYDGALLSDAQFGTGRMFSIVPSLVGFFGQSISLNTCSYTIVLSDVEIVGIENGDNFLTIYAYGDFDPFDQNTYSRVETYILTTDGSTFKANLDWDITSIKNVNVTANGTPINGNESFLEKLKSEFYNLDGNYKISGYLKNSLGYSKDYAATITIVNRRIETTTLKKLTDGITFESVTSDSVKGVIVFDTQKINSIDSSLIIAKEVECTYADSSKVANTIKWEIPVVNDVPLYSTTPVQGQLAVVIGDSVGGYQTFLYGYIFKNYQITSVKLMNGDYEIAKASPQKSQKFELLNMNPYDANYAFPTTVVLDYSEFTLTYNADFEKQYPASSLVFENVDWNLQGYAEGELWHKGQGVVYSGSFTVCDKTIELSLSFVKALVNTWEFLDQNGDIAVDTAPVVTTYKYVQDANGSYVFVDGKYIVATDSHKDLPHYSNTNVQGFVYYKNADASEVKSLTLDPNKTNYLCLDSYPAKARVSFVGIVDSSNNPIYVDLDLKWDLSALNNDSIISKGYYETVPVYIDYNQKLADVYLWISGEEPSEYYFKYYKNSGLVYLGEEVSEDVEIVNSNVITLKLLNSQGSNLQIKDLSKLSTIHDIICGCDQQDCLGKIYFQYNDVHTESGWFNITEWIGLEQIAALYQNQIANGTNLEDVTGKITLTAKVGNILCNVITISIEKSGIVNPSFEEYLPYANSSVNNSSSDIYSMHATGTNLVVDPYLANPKDGNFYPQKISFYLDGKKVVADIDSWDCSCFSDTQVYNGAQGNVYALISTAFGNVRIQAPTVVKSRVIELVKIDGSINSKVIIVNVYGDNPFGENVVIENGKTMAYKRVDVKFVGDDSYYPMTLKYDITDFVANYAGGEIAHNIDVYVGNECGGYQLMTGYSVYSTQNTIKSIVSDNQEVLDFIPSGEIYNSITGFVTFEGDDQQSRYLANTAWKNLLIKVDTLKVTYTYYDLTSLKEKTVTVAKSFDGLTFAWQRTNVVGVDNMVLNIWNASVAIGNVGVVQQISTGCDKKIKLYDTDFSFNTMVTSLEYDANYTVGDFLNDNAITSIPKYMVASSDMQVELLDFEGNVLANDQVLNAGSYTVKLTVFDAKFATIVLEDGVENQSPITKTVTVQKKEVSELKIMNGDREIFKNGTLYEVYEGLSVLIGATSSYNFDIKVTIKDQNDEIVQEPEEPGEYVVTFESLDDNYVITVGTYTIVIKSIAEDVDD